jgi:heme exporter protein A
MPPTSSNHILRAEKIGCVRGSRRLFDSLSIELTNGQLLFVQGKNGSGKTTLLRAISGLGKIDTGQISWDNNKIENLSEEYHSQLLYIGHYSGLKDDLTAIENLQFIASLCGLDISRDQIVSALTELGIEHCADLPARVLSQGQKRRVGLARLWLTPKSLWVLDEPFTALDATTVYLLTQHIEHFVNAGGMVVFTSHQEPGFSPDIVKKLQLS